MQPSIQVEYDSDRISAPIEIPEDSPSPEAIRRAHIGTEASIKAIGHLLLIGVALGGFGLLGSLGQVAQTPAGILTILTSVGLLIGNGISGVWLRNLDPRGRTFYTALFIVHCMILAFQAPGLIDQLSQTAAAMTVTRAAFHRTYYVLASMAMIPLLLRTVFLYVLWNRKARLAMTEYYQTTIIPATPHIEYRSRVPLLILLGVALLIAVVIALAIVSA
jgi:hypothetical protein